MTDTTKPSKPKLLVLSSTYPRWDNDWEPAFVHELSKRLTQQFDVTTLCPREKGSTLNEQRDGVNVIRYRYAPNAWSTLVSHGGIAANIKNNRLKWLLVPLFLLAQTLATWRAIRDLRPELIHCHWIIPQGFCLYLALRFTDSPPKFLLTSHGGDLYTFRGKLVTKLKKIVLRRANFITVVSSAMREVISSMEIATNKVRVIPMGIDTQNRFKPNSKISRSPNEILFVGRLVEKKGLKYLLEALPEVAQAIPNVKLSIIGDGPERAALRKQSADLGIASRVEFLGSISNEHLPTHYQRAAVFVAPFVTAQSGDEEGFGLVVAEALSCNCPVIVTIIDATRDIRELCPHPENLLGIPAGSPTALSTAIVEIMQGKLDEPGGYNDVRKKLDWSAIAYNYAKTLINLCR